MTDSMANIFAATEENLIHSAHLQIKCELEKQMEIDIWIRKSTFGSFSRIVNK